MIFMPRYSVAVAVLIRFPVSVYFAVLLSSWAPSTMPLGVLHIIQNLISHVLYAHRNVFQFVICAFVDLGVFSKAHNIPTYPACDFFFVPLLEIFLLLHRIYWYTRRERAG